VVGTSRSFAKEAQDDRNIYSGWQESIIRMTGIIDQVGRNN
jgi:hypothetical protein